MVAQDGHRVKSGEPLPSLTEKERTMTQSKMPPIHPAAEIYPLLSDADLADLANDIKRRGQKVPIVMIGDAILDGRNRWKACMLAEVEPVSIQWDGQGDPLDAVESLNLKRRQLTPAQRAAVAAGKVVYYRQADAARVSEARKEGGKKGGRGKKTSGGNSPPKVSRDEGARSVVKAAKAIGAGSKATKILCSIKEHAPPAVFELARDGRITIAEAQRIADSDKAQDLADRIKGGERPKTVIPPAPKRGRVASPPAPAPEPETTTEPVADDDSGEEPFGWDYFADAARKVAVNLVTLDKDRKAEAAALYRKLASWMEQE